MIKIIETNLSLNPNDGTTILDHQARVIEVESWKSYVEEILEGNSLYRKALFGVYMEGYSLPVGATIEDFKSDEHHLSYTIVSDTWISKKMAYLIQ